MGKKKIAIVGAGAKAAAIVARAATLRGLGWPEVPELVVFEKDHVGSAWSGQSGFSSGFLTLCTPGEKDVGFPYDEAAVSPALFARFSWSAYLVARKWMSEWVDRGRPHPDHRRWADYLQWVFYQARQATIHATVTRVTPDAGGWQVTYNEGGASVTMQVDAVVLTGTGQSKSVEAEADVPPDRALNAETFWSALPQMSTLDGKIIIVVGDGGAAGTIVAWLADYYAERKVSIIAVNPMGTLFPRGDGYAERRWFSDPSDWTTLGSNHRQALIERTEAGVVSLRNKHLIDTATSVAYRWGYATKVRWDGDEVEVEVKYGDKLMDPVRGHYVVSAIGFDGWSLLERVGGAAAEALTDPNDRVLRSEVEARMTPALTLPPSYPAGPHIPGLSPPPGLPAGLHVPGLAGLAQGPGMGNLGCLGLMANRVLFPYVAGPPEADLPTDEDAG